MPSHEQFANAFYMSKAWRRCRQGYLLSVAGLCEACSAEGVISIATEVHHRKRLTPSNISDPSVALNWSNLQALCNEHHQERHGKTRPRTDADGRVDL